MTLWTRDELLTLIADWKAAYKAASTGKSYAIGSRTLTRYDLDEIRLADKTFYTPDFLVITADGGMELHEVKGHWEDDARVKIKVAARLHPWFVFRAVKAAQGGRWEYEDFGRAGR